MELSIADTGPKAARRAPRREGQQRSVATRRRLLAATIDCIVEHGYASTTTTMVADRADVSRGAQQHHYPTKADLVVAAMDELAAQAGRAIRGLGDKVGTGQRSLARTLQLLFEDAELGTALIALIELDTAARTDAELRAVWRGHERRIQQAAIELLTEVFRDRTPEPEAAAVVTAGFLAAMALAGCTEEQEDRLARLRQAPKTLLKLL